MDYILGDAVLTCEDLQYAWGLERPANRINYLRSKYSILVIHEKVHHIILHSYPRDR